MKILSDCLALLPLLLLACASADSGGGASTTLASTDAPVSPEGSAPRACEDFTGYVADLAVKCGGDRADNLAQVTESVACGGCSNVLAVYDETALRGTCMPALGALTCKQLFGEAQASVPGGCLEPFKLRNTCQSPRKEEAGRACLDLAQAVDGAVTRCGGQPGETSGLLLKSWFCGDCTNAVAVSYPDTFYSDCIGALQNESCSLVNDMANDTFPPACKGRFIVSQACRP